MAWAAEAIQKNNSLPDLDSKEEEEAIGRIIVGHPEGDSEVIAETGVIETEVIGGIEVSSAVDEEAIEVDTATVVVVAGETEVVSVAVEVEVVDRRPFEMSEGEDMEESDTVVGLAVMDKPVHLLVLAVHQREHLLVLHPVDLAVEDINKAVMGVGRIISLLKLR